MGKLGYKKNGFYLLEEYKALGTSFWVECFDSLLSEQKDRCDFIQKDIETIIQTFEQKYSRFKSDSLVAILSTQKSVPFDDDLFSMLSFAETLREKTSALFSPYFGDTLSKKGYGESFVTTSFKQEKEIYCSNDNDTLYLSEKVSIDLGGLGKGYLIDLIAKRLILHHNVFFFLINGGGDMYVTSDNGNEITVYLEHPLEEGSYLGKICLRNSGFAASSSFKRMWNSVHGEVNHFVKVNQEVWGASFVVAENALIADALATSVLLLLPEKKKQNELCSMYDASFFLVDDEGVFLSPTFPKVGEIV